MKLNQLKRRRVAIATFLTLSATSVPLLAVPSTYVADIQTAGTQLLEDGGLVIVAALSVAVVFYGVRRIWGVFKGIK